MSTSFLEIFTLITILHCFTLSFVILLSKFFKNSNNKYLGFTLLIIAIVGLNNWFWDIGISPSIINISDLPLWQFLYPLTYFLFFYKTSSNRNTLKLVNILIFPFLLFSLFNIIISLNTVFQLYNLPEIIKNNTSVFYKTVSFFRLFFLLL